MYRGEAIPPLYRERFDPRLIVEKVTSAVYRGRFDPCLISKKKDGTRAIQENLQIPGLYRKSQLPDEYRGR